jgi:hypothetical protein
MGIPGNNRVGWGCKNINFFGVKYQFFWCKTICVEVFSFKAQPKLWLWANKVGPIFAYIYICGLVNFQTIE